MTSPLSISDFIPVEMEVSVSDFLAYAGHDLDGLLLRAGICENFLPVSRIFIFC
jgi:hypothetical protein